MLTETQVNIYDTGRTSAESALEVIAVTPHSAVEDFLRDHPQMTGFLKEYESAGELAHAARTLASYDTIVLKLTYSGTISTNLALQLLEGDGGTLLHDIGKPGISEDGDMSHSKKYLEYEKYYATDEELELKKLNPQKDVRPNSVVAITHLHPSVGESVIHKMAEKGLISKEEAETWGEMALEHHEIRLSMGEEATKISYPEKIAPLPLNSVDAWRRVILESADIICAMSEHRQGRSSLTEDIIEEQLGSIVTDTAIGDTFRHGDGIYIHITEYQIKERKHQIMNAALTAVQDLEPYLKSGFKFFRDTELLDVARMSNEEQLEAFPIYRSMLGEVWAEKAQEFNDVLTENSDTQFFHRNRE